jgi:diguanylate cyclase (GGDEF)-like protein
VAVEVSPRLIVQDGRPVGVKGIARDVSERRRFEAELRHQAFHDSLTGLPNRVLFLDRLEQIVQHAERRVGYQFAVLFLDLDRFKIVNDSLGHLVGDRLLTALAERLQACLRPGDTVARLGGDEFAILLPDLASATAATDLAERLGAACRLPFNLDGHEVRTATSIGIVLGPGAYRETAALLRDADSAMYTAKAQGKARHVVFSAEMHVHALALMRLEHDLRCALDAAQFSLHYQPIVALDTGHVTGFEALVRWQHPQRGLVAPGEFIPLAEETGLIVPLGWWIIEEACRQLCVWHEASLSQRELSMSINLSAAQFAQADLIQRIQGALRTTGLAPEYLIIEITESAIMENAVVATDVLMRLKALGIRLAVDDFGTGYSSLAYLKRFPVDMLKIDKAFVDGLGVDTNDTAIVRAIISLAHTLGLRVTAEGVERAAQAVELHALGCELGQGYHFGKPQPPRSVGATAGLALCA